MIRIFIAAFICIHVIYDMLIMMLGNIQRKKPLPAEVADIYDKERYQSYLSHTADRKKISVVKMSVNFVITMILLFCPMYAWIEKVGNGNPYIISMITALIFCVNDMLLAAIFGYYNTFYIEEKYGLNKKDGKEFWKDYWIEQLMGGILTVVLLLAVTFVGEHMPGWTNQFTVGYGKSFAICLFVIFIIAVLVIGGGFLSIVALKKQYIFSEMEEGELKDKINELQSDSKKKVKKIQVYNESKKSTMKNAFLLKFLWIREFGIADNFMDENSEKELLGVLSHEIGHLKHKRNILNYINYAIYVLAGVVVFLLIAEPGPLLKVTEMTRTSFGIENNNYYLIFIVIENIATPLFFLFQLFMNYKSRWEEDEADRNAVANGYGRELIQMFKNLSKDELVNVYPHPHRLLPHPPLR